MSKKIGIDGSVLTKSHPTGVEVASRELILALLELDQDNEYIIYTPVLLPPQYWAGDNVSNRIVPTQVFWTQRALPPAILRDHLDIFWSPAYMLPPRLSGIKKIATIHDVGFMRFPFGYRLKDWVLSWITVVRAKLYARRIITVSRSSKSDLQKYFWIAEDRVVVIFNSVSKDHLRPHMRDISEKYKLPDDFILVVGRVEPRKNPDQIIKSFATIAENHPSIHLVFAGPSNALANQILREVEDLGLEDRVHFIGFVHQNDLPILYRLALVLLFPSRYEGFGIPILESFAAGTPVITGNSGATAEIADKAALLVDPEDANAISRAVSLLVSDDELREKLVQAGYERLKDFSWEDSAKKLKRLIDGL